MKIYREESLSDFDFWSGAVPVARKLTDEEFDIIEQCLEDSGEEFSDTDINDFFWFETETICEWLGITEDELWARE